MAYSKVGWENLPQQTTPLSAQNLNHMDKGIADLDGRVTTLEQGGGTGGVGVRSGVGINNELFNDTSSHIIESAESKNNHIEGSTNTLKKTDKTYKNDSNHIEGENNIAGGYAGHVENSSNQVHETNAHAGGKHSVASGSGSFAQGRGVIAFGTAAFTTGQSAKGGDSNVTTLVDAEIDWATQANEDEVNRAKRIAAKLIDLWHNDVNFKHQFTASVGSGAMAGGVNTFVNGGSSFGHGYECEVTAQFGFVGGYQSTTLADGGFTWGVDAQTLGSQGVTFGISTRGRAKNGFVIGNHCENVTSAENSFTGGESCQSQAKNAFTFGIYSYGAAENSVAIGEGIVVGTKGQFAVGKYNNNESNALFAVGNGTKSARKNVFEVFDNTIAINTDRISLSTTNDITTLKLGDFAKLQIKPSMASSGQYACSLIMNPIYGYIEPTVIEMDALSSSQICIGYTNNAVMFNYSNGSQPEFYVKDVANSHVTLFSPDVDTEGKDELVKLSMALNNKSLFAAIADLINNGGGSGGSSNAVTYEPDGSLKIGEYASITDSNMGTGVRELVANGSLGPAADPMKITFGYTNAISIPMGYNDSTSINFTSSTFEQPMFTIRGTSNSLKLYDGTDLSTLITTMKGKSYTSLCEAINALITSESSTTIITTYTATVSLDNNKEYHLISKDSTSLTLTLPSTITDDYNSYFSFKSGATATTITISTFDGTLVFKGDDCANGIFTPAANTVYEVALKCIGMDSNNKPYIVARVGAC